MRVNSMISAVLISSLAVASAAASSEQVVTVWSWPSSASSPQPLAEISYNVDTLTSSVAKYTPPEFSFATEDLVRVGLYDPKTSAWRGSVTSAASFNPRHQHKVHVHIDHTGSPYHVDFAAFARPYDAREERRKAKKAAREAEAAMKKPAKAKPKPKSKSAEAKEDPQPIVAILRQTEGPSPHLNKPIVLNEAGKVDDKEPEKTFLQKYWWIIGIFLVLQIFAAGSGDGK